MCLKLQCQGFQVKKQAESLPHAKNFDYIKESYPEQLMSRSVCLWILMADFTSLFMQQHRLWTKDLCSLIFLPQPLCEPETQDNFLGLRDKQQNFLGLEQHKNSTKQWNRWGFNPKWQLVVQPRVTQWSWSVCVCIHVLYVVRGKWCRAKVGITTARKGLCTSRATGWTESVTEKGQELESRRRRRRRRRNTHY